MKFHPSIPTLFLTVLPLSVNHPWAWLYEPGTPFGHPQIRPDGSTCRVAMRFSTWQV